MARKSQKGRKKRWHLRSFELTFNALVAKVRLLFGKEEAVPAKVTPRKRRQVQQVVRTELRRIEAEASDTIREPANIVADTFVQIAEKERKKAIRNGDYASAIVASVVQYYATQARDRKANESGPAHQF